MPSGLNSQHYKVLAIQCCTSHYEDYNVPVGGNGCTATGEPGENSRYRGMITVAYPQSGEVTAIYRMPQAETDFAVPACAASPKDFFFLSSDDQGYLRVVHYLPN